MGDGGGCFRCLAMTSSMEVGCQGGVKTRSREGKEVREEPKFQGLGWNSQVETEMTKNNDSSLSHVQSSEKK